LKKDLAATIGQFSIGNLRQMRRASLAAGADMALCSFAYPDLRHIDWHERNYYDARYTQTSWGSLDIYLHMQTVDVFNEAARRFCEEEGVHYIPLAENLKGGTGLFADIAHLTLVGIQRKADIIFDQIQDLVGRKLAERERR
jgi:hypothetical protein